MINATVDDHEWDLPALIAEYIDKSMLLVKKSELIRCFTEDGQLTALLVFTAKGNPQSVQTIFAEQTLTCKSSAREGYVLLALIPSSANE